MHTFNTKYNLLVFCFVLIGSLTKGQPWLPVAGQIPGVKFTGIAAGVSSRAIIVTTLDSGIYRSVDTGHSWQHVYTTPDSIFSLVDLNRKYFCAGGNGFTYTSSDSGATWTAHTFPFPVPIAQLAFHPSGALIAGTGSKWDANESDKGKGVWLSPDSGKTWSALNNGITKQDPLIQALAITPSGIILAGLNDINVGLGGKYGIMKLDSLNGSWERVSISVHAPFNQDYLDQNLRVEAVFNINITDGQVLASIVGVYSNFGYGFSIQKLVQDIGNAAVPWQVKWVEDSIPSQGSYYEHLINVFKDSHDTLWASVSAASNEIENNIYTGQLDTSVPLHLNMSGLTEQTGRFLFTEGMAGQLYTVSYFTGTRVFTRSHSGATALPEAESKQHGNWQLFPNPASAYIKLTNASNARSGNLRLIVYDVIGNKIMGQTISHSNAGEIPFDTSLLPCGLYVLSVWDEQEQQILRFVKN